MTLVLVPSIQATPASSRRIFGVAAVSISCFLPTCIVWRTGSAAQWRLIPDYSWRGGTSVVSAPAVSALLPLDHQPASAPLVQLLGRRDLVLHAVHVREHD